LPNPGAVTLIDVTLAAHNRQHGGPEYSDIYSNVISTVSAFSYVKLL